MPGICYAGVSVVFGQKNLFVAKSGIHAVDYRLHLLGVKPKCFFELGAKI
jgi:hypothetical protein